MVIEMNRNIVIALLLLIGLPAHGQAFKAAVSPLVEASCIDCHDANTDTQLNFEKLGHDLSDAATFRQWMKIFDRVQKGEMPPKNKPRPEAAASGRGLFLGGISPFWTRSKIFIHWRKVAASDRSCPSFSKFNCVSVFASWQSMHEASTSGETAALKACPWAGRPISRRRAMTMFRFISITMP